MRQATLATAGFERYPKPTRRATFLAEMDRVVPWRERCALIAPVYPKPGKGRSPVGLERMLRIHFLQQWFTCRTPGRRRRCMIRSQCVGSRALIRAAGRAGRDHALQVPSPAGAARAGIGSVPTGA